MKDQFLVFQFNPEDTGKRILESSEVTPKLAGSDQAPDVIARLQLVSFHVGAGEAIDADTKASIRLDLGKDDSSNSPLDTLFWSIAAGLDLYNTAKDQRSAPQDLKSDFNKTFGNRPIEIPGGLGRLSFEVVKHSEPAWWQRVFGFLKSAPGRALTTAVGFPALAQPAIDLLDQLLNRLDQSKPKVLFQSRPMTLALSRRARDEFTGGIKSIKTGVLSPGFCLLARGRDFTTLVDGDPTFYPAYGLLAPKGVDPQKLVSQAYDDPFAGMTYAVLKVGMSEARLNPMLNYEG